MSSTQSTTPGPFDHYFEPYTLLESPDAPSNPHDPVLTYYNMVKGMYMEGEVIWREEGQEFSGIIRQISLSGIMAIEGTNGKLFLKRYDLLLWGIAY
jgi:hypothetical protein